MDSTRTEGEKPASPKSEGFRLTALQISRFQMESPKMIQTLADALLTLEVGQTEAETLNEVSLRLLFSGRNEC